MIDSLEDLNNRDSWIFKATLKRQIVFIDEKLEKWSKRPTRYVVSNAFIQGSVSDIHRIMCLGTDRNIVNDFFSGKKIEQKKCLNCKESKNLHRSHFIDRPVLMENAIKALHKGDMKPIRFKNILIQFIKEHKKCPLYWLCLKCHNEYSNLA